MRERGCESKIPISYLEGLDKEYKLLLKELSDNGSQVEVINWEKFRKTEEVLAELQEKKLVPPTFNQFREIPGKLKAKDFGSLAG